MQKTPSVLRDKMTRVEIVPTTAATRALVERAASPPVAKLAAPRPAARAAAPAAAHPPLSAAAIEVGKSEPGAPIGLDLARLLDGRLLVQGVSGAGKSWTLRRLIEQSAGRIPHLVLDPEGEFRSLAEELGYPHIAADRLDAAALAVLARRARAHRISLVLDLSELDRDAQMKAVAAFLTALIDAPREHWTPVAVVIDEAHLFAPFGGQAATSTAVRKAAIGAVTDLMARGRKRGLVGVLATQRLARLAKSVASEVHNFLIGMNTLDLDIRRAAETIGWDARKAFDRLPMLSPGDFVAVGPAFSQSPTVLRVGEVRSRHIGAAPAFAAPSAVAPDEAKSLVGLDELIAASEADEETRESRSPQGTRSVRAFLREPAAVLAAKVYASLATLVPFGATVVSLGRHFDADAGEIEAALQLLDRYGVLEFDEIDGARAVRLARGVARVQADKGDAP